jgi:hypothetical protein
MMIFFRVGQLSCHISFRRKNCGDFHWHSQRRVNEKCSWLPCSFRVKMRNTRPQQISSGLPLITDLDEALACVQSEGHGTSGRGSKPYAETLLGSAYRSSLSLPCRPTPLCDLSRAGQNILPHQFRTRNDRIKAQRRRAIQNENAGKSTNLTIILPLITVWLQVRVLPGPPDKSVPYQILFQVTPLETPCLRRTPSRLCRTQTSAALPVRPGLPLFDRRFGGLLATKRPGWKTFA